MLKSVIALACALLCASSMLAQVADAATCPADNVVAPCTCGLLGNDGVSLNCNNKGLTDARIDLILEVFAKDLTMGPLGQIDLSLNPLLTRVPSLIQTFTELGSNVELQQNGITSIESGAFNFLKHSNPIRNLYLDRNKLTTIAPNAFKGVKAVASDTVITLYSNQLTRFESPVFKLLLAKLQPFGGQPFANIQINLNAFDCSDCHLAWLIRDNRDLLMPIVGGTCSNGTTFALLKPEGYANCPTFVCPLGYDGQYADPKSCSNYYTCVGGAAFLTNCPNGLVFNPDESRCDKVPQICQLELITTTTTPRPTCPPYDPNVYICVCDANSCTLQLISTTTARPTCPPYDPNVYICVCGATSCNLELIKPTCPPYDPNVYICICGVSSCQLQFITTTSLPPTTFHPSTTCPPYDPNVYTCVCEDTPCNL